MRILVTGAAGRIGAQTVQALQKRGHWVRGLDQVPARLPSTPDSMIISSLLDPNALDQALDGIAAVVHLAALMSWHPQDSDRLFEINVRATFNLLRAAASRPLTRFIFASSGEVYPELRPIYQPINEAHPTHPISTYGLTKLMGEEMVRHFGRTIRLPYTILRFTHVQAPAELLDPASVFSGPRFYVNAKLRQLRSLPPSPAIERSIAALEAVASSEEQLYIAYSPEGHPYRMSLCDVSDIIQGIQLALDHPAALNETFNIGPASAFEFDQAVPLLAQASGLPVIRVRLYTQPYNYETSVEKACRLLGYEPQYTIFDMIDRAAAARSRPLVP